LPDVGSLLIYFLHYRYLMQTSSECKKSFSSGDMLTFRRLMSTIVDVPHC